MDLDKLTTELREQYGDEVKLIVQVGLCSCPTGYCEGPLDTHEQGDLHDTAWCCSCDWEGTCQDLVQENQ